MSESGNKRGRRTNGAPLTDRQVAQLERLAERLRKATEAFEDKIAQLVDEGASPTHVGKAVGLGDSSVRRITWRVQRRGQSCRR